MFDFIDEKLTDDEIAKVASESNLPPLRVAINANGYRQSSRYWRSLKEISCVNLDEECKSVALAIHRQAKNGKGVTGIRSTYEVIRKAKPFIGRFGLMSSLKESILPSLQDAGIICHIGDKIYIHPWIVGVPRVEVKALLSQTSEDDSKPPTIHGYDADEVEKAIQFYRKAKSLLNGKC